MAPPDRSSRGRLQAIARRVVIERGLKAPHEAMQVTGHRSLAMFERHNIKTTREAAEALAARQQLLQAHPG